MWEKQHTENKIRDTGGAYGEDMDGKINTYGE